MTDEELYQFFLSLFMDGYLVPASEDSADWAEAAPNETYDQFISFCKSVYSDRFDAQFYKARDEYNNLPLIKALS